MKTGITVMIAAVGALGGTGIVSTLTAPFSSATYSPPAQCVEWYDGCNMCDKTAAGSEICTDRTCADSGHGFCREYATSTPTSTAQ